MKLGIQCFGLQNMPPPAPRDFFAKLYPMGYRLVEPFLNFGEPSPLDLWSICPAGDAPAFLTDLHELGFETVSAHILGDPAPALEQMISLAEQFGIRQYVVGMPQELTEESCRSAAESYRVCAETLSRHGIALLVHNGGAEPTAATIDGKTAYEFLLDIAGPLVGAQPDLGWLAAGGADPVQWVKNNRERIWSLHYKDRAGGQERPIGKGELNLYACWQIGRAENIPHIMDMDACTLADIEDSARLLLGFENRRDWTDSILCTMDVDSGKITELRRFEGIIEAPNWSADGKSLYYNADGLIYRYDLETDTVTRVDTGFCTNCNNDHVLSPDGKELAVSHMSVEKGFSSRIYRVDLSGEREPVLVTPDSPSFLHGWSQDGELTYCAFRGAEQSVDVYTIPAGGGEERRLTDGVGYNDGPEYAPDGKHIWFNSTRNGLMQIYRMERDGKNLTQMTDTPHNEWFPHVSPDGKRVAYLTFQKGDLDPHQHVANLPVSLSVMDSDGTHSRKLAELFGGQGTINVNSWAPDSRRLAFVKYEPKAASD